MWVVCTSNPSREKVQDKKQQQMKKEKLSEDWNLQVPKYLLHHFDLRGFLHASIDVNKKQVICTGKKWQPNLQLGDYMTQENTPSLCNEQRKAYNVVSKRNARNFLKFHIIHKTVKRNVYIVQIIHDKKQICFSCMS